MWNFLLSLFITFLFSTFGAIAMADTPTPPAPTPAPAPNKPDAPPTHITMTREEYDKLMAGNKKQESTPPPDDDVNEKARKEQEKRDQEQRNTKQLESAVTFNLAVDDWAKKNSDLLPKDISGILVEAHKETYETASAKSAVIKAGIIKSYFSLQDNVNNLTESHKATVEEYLRLTPKVREERAASVYENIFEPALESQRKIKRALELNRGGAISAGSDSDTAYKEKLIRLSNKSHLGKEV